MAYSWKDAYCIGVEEIDRQHQGFFDLLNRILEKQADPPGKVSRTQAKIDFYSELLRLRRYAFTHFLDEEEEMLRQKYTKFFGHKAEHDKFIRKLLDFEEDMVKTNAVSLEKLVDFLAAWLKKHITGADMRFGEFLRGKADRA